MTAKEYLMQLHILDTKISQKMEEYEQLRNMVKGKGISYDGDRVQTSPDNIQEKCIVEYTTIEKNINSLIVQYIKRKDKIINEIHQLQDPRFIRILYDHYVPDKNHHTKCLEEIAVDMRYSYDRVRHMHGHALLAFQKVVLKVDT